MDRRFGTQAAFRVFSSASLDNMADFTMTHFKVSDVFETRDTICPEAEALMKIVVSGNLEELKEKFAKETDLWV